MEIRPAAASELSLVHTITHTTIQAIYPRYYPAGAVAFFLHHHSTEAIRNDIAAGIVFLCFDDARNAVGTVTLRENEILRLFVLPAFQGSGFGRALLDFAEARIAAQYPVIRIDASLPAKSLYLRRGYHETAYHKLPTDNGDFLCYDQMERCSQRGQTR